MCLYGVIIVFVCLWNGYCVCVYVYVYVEWLLCYVCVCLDGEIIVCVYGVIIVFVCVYVYVYGVVIVFMCMSTEWSLCLHVCVQVGTEWSSVVDKCCRGHYQPLLLLYATPNDSAISLECAPSATVMVNSEYCFNKNNSGRATAVSKCSIYLLLSY